MYCPKNPGNEIKKLFKKNSFFYYCFKFCLLTSAPPAIKAPGRIFIATVRMDAFAQSVKMFV